MPKLTVKTIYIDKLNELNVYDLWLANVKQWNVTYPIGETYSFCIYEATDFDRFIFSSFYWPTSAEGLSFWSRVSRQ